MTPPNGNDASFPLRDRGEAIHCALIVPLRARSHKEAAALLAKLCSAASVSPSSSSSSSSSSFSSSSSPAALIDPLLYVGLLATDAADSESEFFDVANLDLQPFSSEFSTAAVWQALGQQAFDDGGAEYVAFCHSTAHALSLLEHDDWAQHMGRDFTTLAETLAGYSRDGKAAAATTLQGFGCVALLHEAQEGDGDDSWGVVLHRSHLTHFEGRVLPSTPLMRPDKYLYYTYAKVNAARVSASDMLSAAASEGTSDLQTKDQVNGGDGNKHHPQNTGQVDALQNYLSMQGINVAALPPSLDVVVPSYRVDSSLLSGICGGPISANQGTVTHVVVDNPSKVRSRVTAMHRQMSTTTKPVIIHVNSINQGVTSSRNRGIKASGADWIVLQDDDVVPNPALLQAYSCVIQRHVSNGQKQLPLGFGGMIHFPAPYNGFTAAMRMSGVPNAFEIAELTRTPVWGCTANVCMRNGPWLRFVED